MAIDAQLRAPVDLGAIYDRFGTLVGGSFVAVCCLVFPLAALSAQNPACAWLYAIAVGMASCGPSVQVSILVTKHFGTKDYPLIFSIFTLVSTLGSSISVPAMGAVYDYTGSYRPAWVALWGFSVIIAICLVAVELSQVRAVPL